MNTAAAPAASGRTFLRVVVALWAVITAASVIVFAVRVNSVVRWSHLFSTTGEEAPGIYAIWKVVNGHPAYEWPDRENYSISLYNYGFYHLYGGVLRLLGKNGGALLPAGRLITAAFALLGIAFHWAVVKRLLPRPAPAAVTGLGLMLVACMWLGRSTVSWWYLTMRPDLPGIVLVVAGLWMVLRALERDPAGRDPAALANALGAAAFFYTAWSLKQSIVLTIGGCCLYLLFTRRWRLMFALGLPFAAGCLLALGLGGEVYRRNIILMPSIAPLDFRWGVTFWVMSVVPNAVLGVMPLLTYWAWKDAAESGRGDAGDAGDAPDAGDGRDADAGRSRFPVADRVLLVVTCAGVSLAGNGLAIFKLGSSQNYMFEPMAHLTTLTAFVLAWCAQSRGARSGDDRAGDDRPRAIGRVAAVLFTLWGALLPVLTLLFPQGINRRFSWNLVYGPQQIRQRQALEAALRDQPHPLLIVDEVLSQPWHATSGRHPALVIDTISLRLAQERGLVPPTLMQDLLIGGKYKSAVFPMHSAVANAAMENGFIAHGLPPEATGGADLVLLKRPGTSTRPGAGASPQPAE